MSETLRLHHYETPPAELLDAPPTALRDLLGGPSLMEFPGRRQQPVFLSVLLHGNETTGFLALQRLLRRYRGRLLPRNLLVFIGNVESAAFEVRRLEGQVDFNRIWPRTELPDCPEARLMAALVDRLRQRNLFASIDIHNNTGRNPYYGCINRLDGRYMALATLFSRTMVYFTRPRGVQSLAMADLCPAVTLECGKPGLEAGIAHVEQYIDDVLHLSELPPGPTTDAVDLFETVARVRIPPHQAFGFDGESQGLELLEDLDCLNFQVLPQGTALGRFSGESLPVVVDDPQGAEADAYFQLCDGELVTRRPMMPSMLTLDATVIRQDCLCYIMLPVAVERIADTRRVGSPSDSV